MEDNKKIHQIQLQKLLFTQNWEDPASDSRALRIQAGETMVTITSGGCNTLGFLLQKPSLIYAVDINGSQNWQMELKMAAMRRLSHPDFLRFLGILDTTERLAVYDNMLRSDLSQEAQIFWDAKKDIIAKGFLSRGRFENFVKIAGRLIHFLQGKKRVQQLFADKDAEEQRIFYEKTWDTFQMRLLFNLMFNKRILASRGLNADYFHFDDGSDSFAKSFYNRLRKALRDIPIQGNYFLSMYILGRYRRPSEMPEYLLPENFEPIKNTLDHIQLITQDAQSWLESMADHSIRDYVLLM